MTIPSIPRAAFLEAIHRSMQQRAALDAVLPVVGWWNGHAPEPLRAAHSFSVYVFWPERPAHWISAEPEEGLVPAQRMYSPTDAEPALEGNPNIRFWLFQSPCLEGHERGCTAWDVSNSRQMSTGLPDGRRDAASFMQEETRRILSIFPRRFEREYRELLA